MDRELKVVVFGGGTGLAALLSGLKHFPLSITAVVTVGDDGGSSGKLRETFNMVAPGDLRRVLVSLSPDEEMFDELFNYRFSSIQDTFLSGHTVGNIILAALSSMNGGNIVKAVEYLEKFLNIKGRVLPVAESPISLVGHFEDGTSTRGESCIPLQNKKIHCISYEPIDSRANPEVIDSIVHADVVIYSAGSLYTSLIANLLFDDVKKALRTSIAPKIYIGNIMTQSGETKGYKLSDHVKALIDVLGTGMIDWVIANKDVNIDKEILKRYNYQNQEMVIPDINSIDDEGIQFDIDDYIKIEDEKIRHDNEKLAHRLYTLINQIMK